MRLSELRTPCAVVDLDVVERNVASMAARAQALGVRLRPHQKTHKCIEAARLMVAGQFGGITVSTLAEARFFAAAGFDDITYAVPLAAGRVADVVALARSVRRLGVLIDHRDAADVLMRADTELEVMVKVDVGYHRAGVDPTSDEAVALVRAIVSAPRLCFGGVLTHAGHSYDCRGRPAILRVAEQERDVIVRFAERLRADGIDVPEVSVGSTPTMSVAEQLAGVTEMRPGNYVFYDAFQAAIGSCALDDCAFSVLASVIGVYPGRVVVDAGALALSKDAGTGDGGYGVVVGEGAFQVASLSQEHGVVRVHADSPTRVGDQLRIIANHSCLAAACHDAYHVVRGDEVVDVWRPTRGW